ncbi:phage portal protein [Bacillus sp. 1663tsa1]|uniref:phage portal protein n=1 Tax=Bacillus sp. 1663tsa1 TaxID=2953804 RepID=UPI0020A2114F|nr:phage portal protein [Bacillus sp. 1663tsa1]MCP1176211.1 phage portal protein [Bacillus sp. 1663tsa1]
MFYKFAEMIDRDGFTPKIIEEAIHEHAALQKHTLDRYGRYKQAKNNVPILTREFDGEAAKKINNKLANDYFGEIVDTKVGYMFGIPVTINYDKQAPGYQTAVDTIERFKKINNLDYFNSETGKFAACCGYDAALCYIDNEGQERVMRVDPWEAIVISKTAFNEPEYGMVYYKTWDEKCRVECYNNTHRIIFEGEEFTELKLQEVDNKPHTFDYCPLFGIPNNAELQGDADKVLTLIDGFDRSFSDMNNEIEQFRLAYMLFIGYEPDDEQLEAMIKTGALWIPTSADGERIEWLVKNLDPAYIDSHLNRLEANITRFAKHVNFTDAAFGRDITGPAMRYKLFALETKSMYFERTHEASMLYMFKVLASAWSKKGIGLDYVMLDIQYTRNIPVNLLDEAQAATAVSAIASKRTALSTLSVVKDVDEELEQIKKEQEEMIDLDNVPEDEDDQDNTDNEDIE